MLRIAVSLFALTTAAAAVAQPAAQSAPTQEQLAAMPPEARAIAEASVAFSTCVRGHAMAAAPTASADATAGAALAACETQRAAIEAAAERLIASPMVPDAQKAGARAQLRQQMDGLRGMIAGQITAGRAAAAQPPAQAPARPQN
jgi:hypothetical protein